MSSSYCLTACKNPLTPQLSDIGIEGSCVWLFLLPFQNGQTNKHSHVPQWLIRWWKIWTFLQIITEECNTLNAFAFCPSLWLQAFCIAFEGSPLKQVFTSAFKRGWMTHHILFMLSLLRTLVWKYLQSFVLCFCSFELFLLSLAVLFVTFSASVSN